MYSSYKRWATKIDHDVKYIIDFVCHCMFTQLKNNNDGTLYDQVFIKEGIKCFGRKAIDTMTIKLTRLDILKVFETVDLTKY